MSGKFLHACGAAIALSLASSGASAAEDLLDEKFAFSLGSYFMTSDTTLRADSIDSVNIGTNIELENTFGFDDETVFRAEALWRFFPRHKLRLMYFSSNRTATDSIDSEIRFEDAVYPVNATVSAKFEFDIAELAYEYEFLRTDRYELGASIGIHNVLFKVRLDGVVSSGNVVVGSTTTESSEVDAPLPVIGLRGLYRLGGNVYLQGHAQYFKIKIGGLDGSIQDYQAGILWQFQEHFGVGAAYNLFDTQVDSPDDGDFRGSLEWKYSGAQVYVRASF